MEVLDIEVNKHHQMPVERFSQLIRSMLRNPRETIKTYEGLEIGPTTTEVPPEDTQTKELTKTVDINPRVIPSARTST